MLDFGMNIYTTNERTNFCLIIDCLKVPLVPLVHSTRNTVTTAARLV